MSTTEQSRAGRSGLVPLAVAAKRLGRSPWTLARLHDDGHLPLVRCNRHRLVPESFLDMVEAAIRPGRAADIAEVARAWFAAHGTPMEASS